MTLSRQRRHLTGKFPPARSPVLRCLHGLCGSLGNTGAVEPRVRIPYPRPPRTSIYTIINNTLSPLTSTFGSGVVAAGMWEPPLQPSLGRKVVPASMGETDHSVLRLGSPTKRLRLGARVPWLPSYFALNIEVAVATILFASGYWLILSRVRRRPRLPVDCLWKRPHRGAPTKSPLLEGPAPSPSSAC